MLTSKELFPRYQHRRLVRVGGWVGGDGGSGEEISVFRLRLTSVSVYRVQIGMLDSWICLRRGAVPTGDCTLLYVQYYSTLCNTVTFSEASSKHAACIVHLVIHMMQDPRSYKVHPSTR